MLGRRVDECGHQLQQPLVNALKIHILRTRVLHADETPVQMLKPALQSGEKGRTRRAYSSPGVCVKSQSIEKW